MNAYLVERYLPGLSQSAVRTGLQRAQAACAELSAAGTEIRYLGSIVLPREESCFCRFDSERRETVAEANERARFPFARITAGLAVTPDEPMSFAEPASPGRPEPFS